MRSKSIDADGSPVLGVVWRSPDRAVLPLRRAPQPGPLTFLISEKPLDSGTGGTPPEKAFLANGIISLEMRPTSDLFVQRRLQVAKMRATKHDTGHNALSFDGGSLEVARAATGTA